MRMIRINTNVITNPKFILIAVCIIATAVFLRLVNIDTDEVLTDEGNYALRAIGWNDFMQSTTLTTPWNWFEKENRLPFWTQISFNDHPPLHFAFIWIFTRIFGISLWAVRLPSVLFGILSIIMVMAILKRQNFIYGAIGSGLFLAISPWHILISRRASQESLVIFLLLLTIYFLLRIEHENKNTPLNWIALGGILGLGILAKYSYAIIFPIVIFFIIYKKWYRHLSFYLAPIIFFITISPILIYNIFIYITRQHFDLQISRFLKMDTTKDWPASIQGIWQGNISDIITYFQNLSSWVSIISIAVIIIGIIYCWMQRDKKFIGIILVSYPMVVFTAIVAAFTLGDFGRSSIILSFIALSFGISSEFIVQNKNVILILLVFTAFAVLSFGAISDRIGKTYLPKILIASFYEKPHGFYFYEKWKNENLSMKYSPIHYSSLRDWFSRTRDLANNSQYPVIIYDQRIIWFGANWYFYKDSFYSENISVLHSGVAELLLKNNVITLDGRKVFFVEADTASMDAKPYFDPVSMSFYEKVTKLSRAQNVMPIIITNQFGENVVKIWEIVWNSNEMQDIAK